MDLQQKTNSSSLNERKLCKPQALTTEQEDQYTLFHANHHPYVPSFLPDYTNNASYISNEGIDDENSNHNGIALSSYRYVFVLAQIFHGIGASALISLGVTYLDESVNKKDAPMFIGIFEASFVLGPAIG